MRELTLEDIGVDLDRVIRLLGGPEKVLQHLSPDDFLRYLSEDQAIALVRSLGKEKVRQLLEAISEEPTD